MCGYLYRSLSLWSAGSEGFKPKVDTLTIPSQAQEGWFQKDIQSSLKHIKKQAIYHIPGQIMPVVNSSLCGKYASFQPMNWWSFWFLSSNCWSLWVHWAWSPLLALLFRAGLRGFRRPESWILTKTLNLLVLRALIIIIESYNRRLGRISKIIKFSHQPNSTMLAKPYPEVPHLHIKMLQHFARNPSSGPFFR